MNKVEVTGCKDCLCHNSCDKYGDTCNLYSQEYGMDIDWEFMKEDGKSPEWCPLKKEPLTLSIKQ
jgi:hypothetical protein